MNLEDYDEHEFEASNDALQEQSKQEYLLESIDLWLVAPIRIIWGDWRARTGASILAFYMLMGLVGPLVVEKPHLNEGGRLVAPFQSLEFPLGTDSLGQDIFAMLVHATPDMLLMIFSGAVFSIILAVGVGTVSGYKGGVIDRGLMTASDIMMTIPGLPLVIVLATIFTPKNPAIVGIILTINAWAGLARALRSQVLTLREESYVEASRTMGTPTMTILREDILPNLMPYVLINFVGAARVVIFSSVGLYFLGILPFDSVVNWGVILNQAYSTGGALYSAAALHWLLAPMMTIIMLSFGLILLSQGTDRLFNPRVRARHAKKQKGKSTETENNRSSTYSK